MFCRTLSQTFRLYASGSFLLLQQQSCKLSQTVHPSQLFTKVPAFSAICMSMSKTQIAHQSNQSRRESSEEEVSTTVKGLEYTPVDVNTSIQYMNSDAYQEAYGSRPVWYHYRPNHKRGRPRRITRRTCVRGGKLSTGNPCPICRDHYLVIDHRNTKLLEQFILKNGNTVVKPGRSQICLAQHKRLLIALEKAKDIGLIEDVPVIFRNYDYSKYYSTENSTSVNEEQKLETEL